MSSPTTEPRALRRLHAGLAVRALEALGVVVALASLVFFALRVLPGDPAKLVLGDEASAADLARVRALLHLDEGLGAQYARFLGGLCTLDLGDSLRRPGTSAMARVGEALVPTTELALAGVVLGAALGIAAALLATGPWLRPGARGWIDRALVALAATPLLALAPLLTWLLAVRVRLVPLPGDPDAGAAGLLVAGGLLALPLAAHVGRIGRAALADLERAPFLSVARAKGEGRSASGCSTPCRPWRGRSRWSSRRSSERSSAGPSSSSACSSGAGSARSCSRRTRRGTSR